MASDLVIDLVRHMKARNRQKWGEDDYERPLTKLGRRQAEMHAGVMAEGESIVAVYSSPAVRCRQTMEPLARQLGLELHIEPLLAETRLLASLPGGAENPLLATLQASHTQGGRIVACSHGDTIPAFLASLNVEPEWSLPGVLKGFGGWYRVRISADGMRIEHIEAPEGFPQDKQD
jgi:broad specificity phosphatase PhoE